MSEIPVETGGAILDATSAQFSRREKYLAILGALLCFGALWLTGKVFRIPAYMHFSASLLQQPSLIATVIVTAIVYAVCIVIGILIAGAMGFDAGVFCACIGLCALSIRGGAIRFTLFDDPTAGVWIKLTVELALLAGMIAGGTALQHVLLRAGLLHGDDHRHIVTEVHESPDQRVLALLTNVLVITVLMMLLVANDRKAQVLAAIWISSFLGTLAAYYLVPTKPSAWYWSAPIIVGIVGYLLQYFTSSGGWQIGEVRGTFAALARPLPLDYASSGVAAAIMGYWISRRWQHEREINTVTGPTGA